MAKLKNLKPGTRVIVKGGCEDDRAPGGRAGVVSYVHDLDRPRPIEVILDGDEYSEFFDPDELKLEFKVGDKVRLFARRRQSDAGEYVITGLPGCMYGDDWGEYYVGLDENGLSGLWTASQYKMVAA